MEVFGWIDGYVEGVRRDVDWTRKMPDRLCNLSNLSIVDFNDSLCILCTKHVRLVCIYIGITLHIREGLCPN